MNDRDADLVVAGGGPGGWASAIAAAVRGMSVILVEPRTGAVDKACGEGVMPSGVAVAQRLGIELSGRPFRGIRYTEDGNERAASVTADFPSGCGIGVRRLELSRALAARGDSAGVVRCQGFVTGMTQTDDVVRLEVSSRGVRRTLTSSWLAVADGLHSPLRAMLGLAGPRRSPLRYGLRRHYQFNSHVGDLVEVYWSADAEAYLTPVSADVVNVALLSRGGTAFPTLLQKFPALQASLSGAEPVDAVRGAGPMGQRAAALRQGRAFLVGDASGYVDALTGEGIALALTTGEALGTCLAGDRPDGYPPQWRRLTRTSRLLTAGLLWASTTPALRRRIVPLAQRAPHAFSAVVAALA